MQKTHSNHHLRAGACNDEAIVEALFPAKLAAM
jgi:hypothetical protein